MMRPLRQGRGRQRGQRGFALEVAVIAVMCFIAGAYVLAQFLSYMQRQHAYASEADAVRQMYLAGLQYATANQATWQQGKTVMYVQNQYAPTLGELSSLGYLSASANSAAFGRWAFEFTLQPNGSVVGAAYTTVNIADASGAPDVFHACSVAQAVPGQVGLCPNPSNPGMLGHGSTQVLNPVALPANVGAYIFVPA